MTFTSESYINFHDIIYKFYPKLDVHTVFWPDVSFISVNIRDVHSIRWNNDSTYVI